MKKLISILLSLALLLSCTVALAEAAEKTTLGNVEVNGVFTVKAKIPEGYEAVDMMDFREENKAWVEVFIMLMPAEGSNKPIYSLTVGMEDVWEKGIKLNDVSDEDLAAIEESFYAEDPDFQITYIESSHGTKILQATDADNTQVIFYSIYEGYEIECSVVAADGELTKEQLDEALQFLSDLDFEPIQK